MQKIFFRLRKCTSCHLFIPKASSSKLMVWQKNLFCVFSRVGSLAASLPTRKKSEKSRPDYPPERTHKVSPPKGLQMEKKIMFFVIPEMPSKTFVMLYKKLPDHFKYCTLMFRESKYKVTQNSGLAHNSSALAISLGLWIRNLKMV